MIKLAVEDADELESDTQDKSIKDYYLSGVGSKHVDIQIVFAKASDITTELNDPDRLEIIIVSPEIFIDAQTGRTLTLNGQKQFTRLGRQYSAKDLAEVESQE